VSGPAPERGATAAAPLVVARHDPALTARVAATRPMTYAAGADPAEDRPAHVRAGSGVAVVETPSGPRLAVVQDDAHFVALVDPATGLAEAVPLPPGVGGRRLFDTTRGNKHHKLDLEACLVVADPVGGAPVLLAFGSGSTDARERVAVVRGLADRPAAEADVTLADASALYAALRAEPAFAGTELNVEGAARVRGPGGDAVRLFARGNGAGGQGSATCDLPLGPLLAYLLDAAPAPPPAAAAVTRYDLGSIDGERLGFTDAIPYAGGVLYLAAAEASADVVEDGPVAGSAVGLIAPDGTTRWAPLVDAGGGAFAHKAEGVAEAAPGRLWVVLDVDDPEAPSLLCEVTLEGTGWR
jgi:hypothetical protein